MATIEQDPTAERSDSEPPPRVDRTVFIGAAVLVVALAVIGVLVPNRMAAASSSSLAWVLANFGWLFVLSAVVFVVCAIYLGLSKYGKVRLGADDERPSFSTLSWIAMMFSAGMGIGLMFFGVAEPAAHFGAPPLGLEQPGTPEAAGLAIQYTYFHWAITPWAIYGMVGLAIAYSTMRKGRPNLISATLFPVLGDRVYGPLGKTVDILAIWATLFGTATSLGYGAAQMNSGLNFLWDVPISEILQIVIIAVLTGLFILSAVSGVEKGVQLLSNINMVIAVLIALFVFLLGPTVFIMSSLIEGTGDYLSQFVPMSFRTGVSGGGEWLDSWTIFYWAWWLSWTPFVGTFLARISRGRTIREYMLGVLVVPSAVTMVWFAIFGAAGIDAQRQGTDLINVASEVSLYVLLNEYPLVVVTSILVVVLVGLFFVSGADAASVVMGTMSSHGSHRPPKALTATWGGLTGASAAALLLSGGLLALQQVTIVLALPFIVIMMLLIVSLFKELSQETLPTVVATRRPPPTDGDNVVEVTTR